MTKIFCDHCGKELDELHDYTDYEIEFEGDIYLCDLCTECKEAICKEIDERLKKFTEGVK